MTENEAERILKATDRVRRGAYESEHETAIFLAEECKKRGIEAKFEKFDMPVYAIKSASLIANGENILCEAVDGCACGTIEAPFIYLPVINPRCAKLAKGKIAMTDVYFPRFFNYTDLADAGVVGLISHNGGRFNRDEDIDRKEMRDYTLNGRKIMPAVNIQANESVRLVRMAPKTVRITVDQEVNTGYSQNVIAEIPGETDEWIIMTAHYDTTFLSHGQYDNMTGCITLLRTLEEVQKNAPNRRGIRIMFTGCEERGLIGAKEYIKAHREELDKIALCVNIDMVGSVMGPLGVRVSAEEKLAHHVESLCDEYGIPADVKQGLLSSDSTPFADAGVPAISFSRVSPLDWNMIHSRYDTVEMLSIPQLIKDGGLVADFVLRMANAVCLPVSRDMPEKLKKDLDEYMGRKRRSN